MKKPVTTVTAFVLTVLMLCATAMLPASAEPMTTDGWLSDLDGNLVTDDAGYYVLILSPGMINDGRVEVNFNRFAEFFLNSFRNKSNADETLKVKIINNTGKKLAYEDYAFTTENMLRRTNNIFNPAVGELTESARFGRAFGSAFTAMLPTITSPTFRTDLCIDVQGFDGKNINLMMVPLRCVNDAVMSLYGVTETYDINLLQMMNRDDETRAKGYTGYADYLRKYYGVADLRTLEPETTYNILGTTRDAQTAVTNWRNNTMYGKPIPASELNLLTNEFKIWGSVYINPKEQLRPQYPYRQNYFMMETDPEVIAYAYDFLYSHGLRFSFDQELRPFDTTDSEAGRGGDFGIKAYVERTPGATANVTAVFGASELDKGETLTLDHVSAGLYVPNAWNQYRMYDYGFSLIYTVVGESPTTTEPGELPDTSDTMPVYLVAGIAGVLLLLLAVQLFFYKRKKKS